MGNLKWEKLRSGSRLSVLAVVLISLFIFLLDRWTGEQWEKQTVAARNLFRAPPRANEIASATIWQRIAKTKEIFKCSSTTMCSPPWFTNPNLSNDGDRGNASASAVCPFYFNWIREDLRPWAKAGITLQNVEAARKFASFRLMIIQGRLYIESYRKSFQTRDLFTVWAFAQLLKFYPGMIPDVDLMFNGNDRPVISGAHYNMQNTPPALFRYCGSKTTFDIPFPDWTFWGWPEVQIPPWEVLVADILNASSKVKWMDRDPTAFWRGNPHVSRQRQDLFKCKRIPQWRGRLYAQDWIEEFKRGFRDSRLADQCKNSCFPDIKYTSKATRGQLASSTLWLVTR